MRIHPDKHFIQLYPAWRECLNRLDLISTGANRFVTAEPLLSYGDAMEAILGELENGRDVLVGDTHTEMSHHLFYAIAVKLAKSRGIEFVSALELPAQLDDTINKFIHNPIIPVDIAMVSIKRYQAKMIDEYEASLRKFILPVLQSERVPVIPFDMCPRPSNYWETKEEDIVNRFMAQTIECSRLHYHELPIFGLAGARHVKKDAIPKYCSGLLGLHLGTNATVHDDPNIAIYEPGDFDGVVDLPPIEEIVRNLRGY